MLWATWAAVVLSLVAHIVSAAFFTGRISTKVEQQGEQLRDHEGRIRRLEGVPDGSISG